MDMCTRTQHTPSSRHEYNNNNNKNIISCGEVYRKASGRREFPRIEEGGGGATWRETYPGRGSRQRTQQWHCARPQTPWRTLRLVTRCALSQTAASAAPTAHSPWQTRRCDHRTPGPGHEQGKVRGQFHVRDIASNGFRQYNRTQRHPQRQWASATITESSENTT
jgi:hypothetical protein